VCVVRVGIFLKLDFPWAEHKGSRGFKLFSRSSNGLRLLAKRQLGGGPGLAKPNVTEYYRIWL
jgi:hypothetical protein